MEAVSCRWPRQKQTSWRKSAEGLLRAAHRGERGQWGHMRGGQCHEAGLDWENKRLQFLPSFHALVGRASSSLNPTVSGL